MKQEKFEQYEVIDCECGHTCPVEFAISGKEDGIWICPNCFIDAVSRNTVKFKTLVHGETGEFVRPFALMDGSWEWTKVDMPIIMKEDAVLQSVMEHYPKLDFDGVELREILVIVQ